MKFWYLTDTGNQATLANLDGPVLEKIEKQYGPVWPWNPGQRPAGIPIHVKVARRFTDFIWTWYSQCLIQDKVLNMFKEEGFTGFDVWPVRAKLKTRPNAPDAPEIPTLWEIILTGWGGIAPPESGIRVIKIVEGCKYYSSWTDASRIIDESQWDGSDFFMVWPLPGFIFVTDRVVEFINKNKLTGVKAIPADAIAGPATESVVPGYLRQWMPEPRAREIGEPLGIY
ncbi:MAG TPA: hypothetical protein PLZ21_01050 [Armatimonadota bacterium]|nr:hypothetical protein [Armatimonadota bacterium]